MPTPRYFLTEDGKRTGPHSMAVLVQKAEIRMLTANTLLAPENEPDAWAPLSSYEVLCSELLPNRPNYTLGSRNIERVNSNNVPPAPSISEMLKANLAHEKAFQSTLPKAPPPKRSNKRLRDFLIVSITLTLAAVFAGMKFSDNTFFTIALVGATVFLNACLAWVMFGIMSRY